MTKKSNQRLIGPVVIGGLSYQGKRELAESLAKHFKVKSDSIPYRTDPNGKDGKRARISKMASESEPCVVSFCSGTMFTGLNEKAFVIFVCSEVATRVYNRAKAKAIDLAKAEEETKASDERYRNFGKSGKKVAGTIIGSRSPDMTFHTKGETGDTLNKRFMTEFRAKYQLFLERQILTKQK